MTTPAETPRFKLFDAPDAKAELRRPGGRVLCIRKELVGAVLHAEGETSDNEKPLSFVISTSSIDRDNDTVDQKGWVLDAYQKNPVMLWAHDYSQMTVGKAAGGVVVKDGRLVAMNVEFPERDLYEFGWLTGQMYRKGFLSAVSAGYRPLEYSWSDRGGMACDFKTQELLEFSAVPVPANPEALLGAKAAGLPLKSYVGWAERILQDDAAAKDAPISRAFAEKLFRVASTKSTHQVPVALAPAESSNEEDGAAPVVPPTTEQLVDALDDLREEMVDLKKTLRVLTKTVKALGAGATMAAASGVGGAVDVQPAPAPSPVVPLAVKRPTADDIGKAAASEVARQMREMFGL